MTGVLYAWKEKIQNRVGVSRAQDKTGIFKFLQHPCCEENAVSIVTEREAPKKENYEEFSEIQKLKKLNPGLNKNRPPWKGRSLSTFTCSVLQFFFFN